MGDPANTDDELTIEEASEILEVPVEQVQTMLDDGMLDSLKRADVEAVDKLGG